ncbi:MAG: hypothetical protein Tsb006_6400 [Rickettsiaceae bacterium]
MLDRFAVHLKNVIFFKAVVYTLLAVILGLLIPIFKSDVEKLVTKRQKATTFLQDTTFKLESIADFEEKVLSINERYNALVKDRGELGCVERTKFLNDVKRLSTKYGLFEPINIKIFQGFEGVNFPGNSVHLKMNYYTADIQFRVTNLYQILSICADIYNAMPQGAAVISQNIHAIEALTPRVIETLNTDKAPDNLEVRIKILLRNIVYEQ